MTKYLITWNINGYAGHGSLTDNRSSAYAWAQAMNAEYGEGTHKIHEISEEMLEQARQLAIESAVDEMWSGHMAGLTLKALDLIEELKEKS
jgi:hypothetical protein